MKTEEMDKLKKNVKVTKLQEIEVIYIIDKIIYFQIEKK